MACVRMYDVVVLRVPAVAWEPETGSRVPVGAGTRGTVVEMTCPAEWITLECAEGLVDVRAKDVVAAESVPVQLVRVPLPLPGGMPGAADVRVKGDKLVRYLLDPGHPTGGPKASWLSLHLGYERHHRDRLRAALVACALGRVVSCSETATGGLSWAVVADLAGPNGRTERVVTVWATPRPGATPAFITLRPAKTREL